MFKWLKRSSGGINNPEVLLSKQALRDAFYSDSDRVILNGRSVMSHPIVRRGVNLIANLASTLPINVMKDGGVTGREVDLFHPWQYRLNTRPTGYCNRATFVQKLFTDAIVEGNSYYLILDDRLMWLDPLATQPDISQVDGSLVYRTTINNQHQVLLPHQVLHVRSNTTDTICGESLYSALTDALASGLAMYKHIRRYYEQGTFSSLAWTLAPEIKSKEKADEFARSINDKYAGAYKAFRNIFLMAGSDVKPIAANNQTAQTQELLEFDIVVIAAALGLPPSALGANQNTSYNSLEMEDKKYLRDINHWLIQTEQEFSSKLLSEADVRSGERWIEFNRNAIVEMSKMEEMALLEKGLSIGAYSKEFVRRKLNVPIEDVEGELYFVPSNLTPYKGGEEPIGPNQPQQPQEQPQQPQESEEKDSEPQEEDDSKEVARGLSEAAVERLLTRIERAVLDNGKTDLEPHREVFIDSLRPFKNASEVFDTLIRSKQEELNHVLPEQRKEVLSRINKEALMEALWKI